MAIDLRGDGDGRFARLHLFRPLAETIHQIGQMLIRESTQLPGTRNDLAGNVDCSLAHIGFFGPLAETVHQYGQLLMGKSLDFVGTGGNLPGDGDRRLTYAWLLRPLAETVYQSGQLLLRKATESVGLATDLRADGDRRFARAFLFRPLAETVHQVRQVLRYKIGEPLGSACEVRHLGADSAGGVPTLRLVRPFAEAIDQVGQALRTELGKSLRLSAAKNLSSNCESALATPWLVRPLAKAVHQQRDVASVQLAKHCWVVAAELGDPDCAVAAFRQLGISTERQCQERQRASIYIVEGAGRPRHPCCHGPAGLHARLASRLAADCIGHGRISKRFSLADIPLPVWQKLASELNSGSLQECRLLFLVPQQAAMAHHRTGELNDVPSSADVIESLVEQIARHCARGALRGCFGMPSRLQIGSLSMRWQSGCVRASGPLRLARGPALGPQSA
ncbi:hypothetical protein EOA32_31595 [Mesorhizobium sp. M1A.F.Ca.ET.072.01.1.1]|nr:hypothetical protein EOA32_31595 [Mesorhizobium sp. M1A.F.Ca.ET.072.01.1.1]